MAPLRGLSAVVLSLCAFGAAGHSCSVCDSLTKDDCVDTLYGIFEELSDRDRLAFYRSSTVLPNYESLCGIGTDSELSDDACRDTLDTSFSAMGKGAKDDQMYINCDTLSQYITPAVETFVKKVVPSSSTTSYANCDLCESAGSQQDCFHSLLQHYTQLSDTERLAFYKQSSVIPDAPALCGMGTDSELGDKACRRVLDSAFSSQSRDDQGASLVTNCDVLSSSSRPAAKLVQLNTMTAAKKNKWTSCELCDGASDDKGCYQVLLNEYAELSDKDRLAFYRDSTAVPDLSTLCGVGTDAELGDKACRDTLDDAFSSQSKADQKSNLIASCDVLSSYVSTAYTAGTRQTKGQRLAKFNEQTKIVGSAKAGNASEALGWSWSQAFQNMMIGFFGGAFIATLVLVLAKTRSCRSLKSRIMKSRDMISISRYAYSNVDDKTPEPRKFGTIIEGDFRESLEDDNPFAISL